MSAQINEYQYKYETIPYGEIFLCIVRCNGEIVGDIFEARACGDATAHERAAAWYNLHIGNYPGTVVNEDDDGNEDGAAA